MTARRTAFKCFEVRAAKRRPVHLQLLSQRSRRMHGESNSQSWGLRGRRSGILAAEAQTFACFMIQIHCYRLCSDSYPAINGVLSSNIITIHLNTVTLL